MRKCPCRQRYRVKVTDRDIVLFHESRPSMLEMTVAIQSQAFPHFQPLPDVMKLSDKDQWTLELVLPVYGLLTFLEETLKRFLNTKSILQIPELHLLQQGVWFLQMVADDIQKDLVVDEDHLLELRKLGDTIIGGFL